MPANMDTSTIDCRVPYIHHPCLLREASWIEICQLEGLIRTSHHRRSIFLCQFCMQVLMGLIEVLSACLIPRFAFAQFRDFAYCMNDSTSALQSSAPQVLPDKVRHPRRMV
jgi:hypothetical protein